VTGFTTLGPRTSRRPVVSQPLGALNQYRAPNLRSSWPCSYTRLISSKNTRTIGELWTKHDSHGSSHREIQATLGELWTTSPNGHELDITKWWYMCAPFLVVWFQKQPVSSSSSNSVIVLIWYFFGNTFNL
jgi:hypothetical protein